jgi:hypothetical protein
VDLLEGALLRCADLADDLFLLGARHARLEADQKLARHRLWRPLRRPGRSCRPPRAAGRKRSEQRRDEKGEEWDAGSTAFHRGRRRGRVRPSQRRHGRSRWSPDFG